MVAFSGCKQNEPTRSSTRTVDYHIFIVLTYADPLHPEANHCKSLTVPSYLSVAKKDNVTWDVVNLCGNTETVAVKDFLAKDDPNNHKDPLEPDQSKPLKFKVKDVAESDTYKYKVYVGTAIEDPEIYVER
jgi:hypothetical protein